MSQKYVIAGTDELQDGQMKQVKAGEHDVLLLRLNGRYHALGATCPHHGAPLADGALCDHKVVCPWHQSVFDAVSGDLEQPPSLDAIPRYDVAVENEEVVVFLPDQVSEGRYPKGVEPPPRGGAGDTYVIVGSGGAGAMAAETLRWEGFRGKVIMISTDPQKPYDRTELSKRYLADPEAGSPDLRSDSFYGEHNIELRNARVDGIEPDSQHVVLSGGEKVSYDQLLVATGASPRSLNVEGEDLENVFLLRSRDDCERIISAAKNAKNAVVVGASFIGMEGAASLNNRGLDVTVVAPESVPYKKTLGEPVGLMLQKLHEEQGEQFMLQRRVQRFEGEGAVQRVVLDGGETIEADMVLIGIGVTPNTEALGTLNRSQDGSVTVSASLQAHENIYAAGDIARFPDWRSRNPIRIEHWRVAQQHGRIAAQNMLGRHLRYDDVPFFWTRQHKLSVQYVGHATGWDDIVIDGDLDDRKFIAYYVAAGGVVAAVGCGRGEQLALIAEELKAEQSPKIDVLRDRIKHAVEQTA